MIICVRREKDRDSVYLSLPTNCIPLFLIFSLNDNCDGSKKFSQPRSTYRHRNYKEISSFIALLLNLQSPFLIFRLSFSYSRIKWNIHKIIIILHIIFEAFSIDISVLSFTVFVPQLKR